MTTTDTGTTSLDMLDLYADVWEALLAVAVPLQVWAAACDTAARMASLDVGAVR